MCFCKTQGQEYKHGSEWDWTQKIQVLGTREHSFLFVPLLSLCACLGFSGLCCRGINKRLDIFSGNKPLWTLESLHPNSCSSIRTGSLMA